MNAKIRNFHTCFYPFIRDRDNFDKEMLFIAFDSLSEEEKVEALEGHTIEDITAFLNEWKQGLSISKDTYNQKQRQFFESSESQIEVGGKDKIFAIDEFLPSFIILKDYPISHAVSLLEREDLQVVSVILHSLQSNERTILLYHELKSFFPDALPPVLRPIKREVIREIERTLERKLAYLI